MKDLAKQILLIASKVENLNKDDEAGEFYQKKYGSRIFNYLPNLYYIEMTIVLSGDVAEKNMKEMFSSMKKDLIEELKDLNHSDIHDFDCFVSPESKEKIKIVTKARLNGKISGKTLIENKYKKIK